MTKRSLYSHLDPEKQEIRVVTLQPDEGISTLIKCELRTISLSDDFIYEALSYVWVPFPESEPNHPRTKPIQLDGTEFEVTVNLHSALLHLRQKCSPRILWIDAICIDQQDFDEKKTQIKMMGEIYKGANQVVAFLGEGRTTEYEAIDAIIELGKDSKNHLMSSKAPHINPDVLQRDLFPVSQLIRTGGTGWWTRIWTMQETILAKELVFVCGNTTFPWSVFEDACVNFLKHSDICCAEIQESSGLYIWFAGSARLIERLGLFRQRRLLPLDILELSMFYRWRRATVLHDKIHGFLGLSAEAIREGFVVDYEKPLRDCYVDSTVTLIKTSQTLDVFLYLWNLVPHSDSDFSPREKETERLEELPFWVPDWRQDIKTGLLEALNRQSQLDRYYNACGSKDAEVSMEDNGLHLSGLEIDRIQSVGPARSDETGVLAISSSLVTKWKTLALNGGNPKDPYIAGGSIEKPFVQRFAETCVVLDAKFYPQYPLLKSTKGSIRGMVVRNRPKATIHNVSRGRL